MQAHTDRGQDISVYKHNKQIHKTTNSITTIEQNKEKLFNHRNHSKRKRNKNEGCTGGERRKGVKESNDERPLREAERVAAWPTGGTIRSKEGSLISLILLTCFVTSWLAGSCPWSFGE